MHALRLLCLGLLASSVVSMSTPGRRASDDDTGESGAALRAGELKKRLQAAGVDTLGILDKSELVQLYDELSAEQKSAAIAKVSTPPPAADAPPKKEDIEDILKSLQDMPGMEGLKMFNADDLANMNPEKMASMFGNMMGNMGGPPGGAPDAPKEPKTVEEPPAPKEIKQDDSECRRRRRRVRLLNQVLQSTPAGPATRRRLGWDELKAVLVNAAHSFGIHVPFVNHKYDAHVTAYHAFLLTHQRDAHTEAYEAQRGWGGQQEWLEEWSERMACWWEATPFRGGVQACSADVEKLLETRFEAAKGGTAARLQQAAKGCEWVPTLADRLQLPAFPDFGKLPSLEFTLPRQLLPWSVQKWQEAGEQSALPSGRTVPTTTTTSTSTTVAYDWQSFGMGAGGALGGAALVGTAFYLRSRAAARG